MTVPIDYRESGSAASGVHRPWIVLDPTSQTEVRFASIEDARYWAYGHGHRLLL